MKRIALLTVVGLLVTAGASAQSTTQAKMTPQVGPESKALGTFFAHGGTWNSEVAAGALGPNSKATTSQGKAMCSEILGGLWYSCDVEETIGTGNEALVWKGHMVVGYDLAQKTYRATMIDNMGTLTNYNGTLTGKKLALETPVETNVMGQVGKHRLTFDKSTPNTYRITEERKLSGGEWMKVATGVFQETKRTAARPTFDPEED